jgi:hypothetical protein
MDSRHPLLVWIEANSTQAKFAGAVPCSQGHLSDVLSGKKSPSGPLTRKLSQATGGAVSIAAIVSWTPPSVEQPAGVAQVVGGAS